MIGRAHYATSFPTCSQGIFTIPLDFRFLFAYLHHVKNPATEVLFKNGTADLLQNCSPVAAFQPLPPRLPYRKKPWTFPSQGIAVFYGLGNVPKLSHYFLPRLLLQGRRVLFLDGANSANPRLLARLARERYLPFERFNRQIQIARAFTCF
jgi:hypothetical protein